MASIPEDLRASVAALPDGELTNIADVDCGRHPTPTLLAAIAELERRGLPLPENAKRRPPAHEEPEPPPKKRASSWFFPRIEDEASALRVARQGAIASWIVAGMTILLALASLRSEAVSHLGFSLWSLLDAAIFAGIGLGTWRGSLAFAATGLLMYIAERVFMWVTTDSFPGGIVMLMLLAFANGFRGALALHEYRSGKGTRSST